MPQRTQHDSPTKNRFIGRVEAGETIKDAADHEDIPRTTGSDIWKKYQETGSTHNRPRTGRPTKLTPHMKRIIVRQARKNRRRNLHELGKSVTPTVSASTARRVLSEVGLHRRRARKVIYLKKAHRRARKLWAKRFKHYTPKEWAEKCWSDECYVYIGDSKGTVWVTRSVGEEFDDDCVIPTFKQSSIRVMIWGCIMKGSKGPLVVLEYPGGKGGGMTADRYQEQGVLLDYLAEKKRERGYVEFQQDGAPSHTAKSTLAWFARNKITLFPHPASSPDLSPIEPVWKILKGIIRSRPHPPTSLTELILAVREAWDQITIEQIDAHINHMADRVQAVLEQNGGNTRF